MISFSFARVPVFFFFNDTATTEIYTLSLHDALPISAPTVPGRSHASRHHYVAERFFGRSKNRRGTQRERVFVRRSEEHTSELQSQSNLVCRLLLEKKNTTFYCNLQHFVSLILS